MKALILSRYGAINEGVALAEIPTPMVGAADVLVDVHAVSINPIDYKIIQGSLRPIQKLSLPMAIGFDVSGVISAVGANVSKFKTGDEVFARSNRHRMGAFAEQVALDESWVALKPKSCNFSAAASLPLVALTTVQGLHDRAHAKAGQRILIHAGSGGVGTFAIQYAKTLGLHVTTTTSSRNVALVQSLGADRVICYDQESYLQGSDRYDIVFDTLGNEYTVDAFKVVNRGGAVVSIAGVPDRQFADQVNAGFVLRTIMGLMSHRVYRAANKAGARYFRFLTESSGAQLSEIARLVDSGSIKPIIDRVFSFPEIKDALEYAALGRARGKVIVQVRS